MAAVDPTVDIDERHPRSGLAARSIDPKRINRKMYVAEIPASMPKTPSVVMNMLPTIRSKG